MDGTKFAIISKTLKKDQIVDIYRSIQKKASTDFYVDNQHIAPSFCAGLVVVDNFDISDKTVYACLKYAYFQSKKHRMGDIVIYEDAMNEDSRKNLEKLSVIRREITETPNGFYLVYQPVVYADNEKLKGVEALIRWKSERYGIVPPNDFIPVIEHDSLFPQLGKWILEQAMWDGNELLKKYPDVLVNVNLSYAQLEKEGFIEDVLGLLDRTGFPADHLCLELTERCRLIDRNLLKDIIAILRDEGIKFAIDDFGTGFASLDLLKEMRADIIKIDRAFVKGIVNSKVDRGIVKFIAELATNFGADLCIEGVENKEMRDVLREYNHGSFQGYLYSKPVTIDEFMKLKFSNK